MSGLAMLAAVADYGGLQRYCFWILLVLFLLFCLRVVGQMLVMFFHVSFLPRAEAWFSGLMAYPHLLASQILIILLYGKICLDFYRGSGYFVDAHPGMGPSLLLFGSSYLGLMLLRYVLRMGLYPHERWTGGCIPIFFHWVLSSFVLVVAIYHLEATPWPMSAWYVAVGAFLICAVAAWAMYQLAPSLLARRWGLGRSEYAVRPEKQVAANTSAGRSIRVDVHHPQRKLGGAVLVIRIAGTGEAKGSVFAGLIAKMWAERGFTVILRKGHFNEGAGDDGIGAWVRTQGWFGGGVVEWSFGSVRELAAEMRVGRRRME